MREDLTKHQMLQALFLSLLLHLFILSLFVLDVVPQQFHQGTFRFHHGGDQNHYFDLAMGLLKGDVPVSIFPLGFPLLLTPFMLVLRPEQASDLIEPVAAFWGIFMFPLGQWILAGITKHLTGRRDLAVASVALWTSLPLAVYILCRLVGTAEFAETSSVHLTWMHMLSDGPATLFTLLLIGGYFLLRQKSGAKSSWFGLGCVAGFLMLIRLPGTLTVAIIGVALLVERQWSPFTIFVSGALLFYAPQLLYNTEVFGSPTLSGYQVLRQAPADGYFSWHHFGAGLLTLWETLGILLVLVVVVSLLVGGFGLLHLFRRSRLGAAVIAAWLISHVLFFGPFYASWWGSHIRYLMPAYPAAAILISSGSARLVGWLRS